VTEQGNGRTPLPSRPTEPGWWLGSDGQWHPPEARPAVPFKPQEPGWTQRDDGLWYPPNHASAGSANPVARRERVLARPPEPGWWQASDGWWYPPEAEAGAWGSAPAQHLPTQTWAGAPPAPAAATGASRWRSLRGLANALTALFWVDVALNLLLLAALANQRVVYEDFQSRGPFGVDPDRVDVADGFVAAATGFEALLRIAIAVVFIIWFWRAAKNNHALDRQNPRFRPGWAVGSWFIPVANLVIPVLITQDLWKGAEAARPRGDRTWREEPASPLVWSWWGLYVAASVAYVVSSFYGPSIIDNESTDFRPANMWLLAATVAFAGAAALAVYVVRQLSERQEDCLLAQQQAWSAAHSTER
jgi:Domain of unknown function (DUF4328)